MFFSFIIVSYFLINSFLIESGGPGLEDISKFLSVVPASSDLLSIHDRNSQSQQVQVSNQ
jgi:hypothetical protein